ncbi:unnamed protein product [Vicia faba]|uniref:Uncharacterized protein n=1 Tax=Vicia faba TaxID=3906 RepID=A0AAV1B792_VICFA|nr:unnamed protein product [Vicia faba]
MKRIILGIGVRVEVCDDSSSGCTDFHSSSSRRRSQSHLLLRRDRRAPLKSVHPLLQISFSDSSSFSPLHTFCSPIHLRGFNLRSSSIFTSHNSAILSHGDSTFIASAWLTSVHHINSRRVSSTISDSNDT